LAGKARTTFAAIAAGARLETAFFLAFSPLLDSAFRTDFFFAILWMPNQRGKFAAQKNGREVRAA
jgi:hypothetical protein